MGYDRIPEELKELRQWVAWMFVTRDGKPTKLPINPTTGDLAKTDDSTTWGTFEQSVSASKKLNGIGFVFTKNDKYCGIDMDGNIDTQMIEWFDSYTEKSQSGNGAHIITEAVITGGKGRKNKEYEVYDRGRYFVFTGDVIKNRPIKNCQAKVDEFLKTCFPKKNGTPVSSKPIEPEELDISGLYPGGKVPPSRPRENPFNDIFDLIRNSKQGSEFDTYWEGGLGKHPSQSEADLALLDILHFYTGGDKAEAFRLFDMSPFGQRGKWKDRQDYRERNWDKVNDGEVYTLSNSFVKTEIFPVSQPQINPVLIKQKLSPWRNITTRDVRQVIAGTALEPLVDLFSLPMDPPLPLEATLIKALVVAGCALCKKDPLEDAFQGALYKGIRLARLKIMSAGGQASNIYGILVAPSGSGKDVGGLIDYLAGQNGWIIASAGSAEGLADILSNKKLDKSNGFISISEFANWLDKKHWQSKAASFLTDAFNRGYFSHAFSARNGAKERVSNYCYPSILANIQPETMTKYASTNDISSGFLSRFLISVMPTNYYGRPTCREFDAEIDLANQSLSCYLKKEGEVIIPDKYLNDVFNTFIEYRAGIRSHWMRLINEYGPRFAVMLSVSKGDLSPEIELQPQDWEGAAIMVQWFYSMAETLLEQIQEDEVSAKRENLIMKIYRHIKDKQETTLSKISCKFGRGTTKKERHDALSELIDRSMIASVKIEGQTIFKVMDEDG